MELKEVQEVLNKYDDLDKELNAITELIQRSGGCINFKISYKNYGENELEVDEFMKRKIFNALNEKLVNILDEQKIIRDTFKDIKVVE